MTLVHVVGFSHEIEIIGKAKTITLTARIDTGAARSAISKEIAEEISAEAIGETVTTYQTDREPVEVPLVRIGIRIDGELFNVEALKRDRKHMPYPARVGRDILGQAGKFIIMPTAGEE